MEMSQLLESNVSLLSTLGRVAFLDMTGELLWT